MKMKGIASRVWSIVLAGGEGERLQAFVSRWLGIRQPKQYCTNHHREQATAQLATRGGRLLYQPANRGTAAGIFLPLTYIHAIDPEATVVIYPADHFVWPENRFEQAIARAVRVSMIRPDRPILVGITPDSPEGDYGWIVPNRTTIDEGRITRGIERFCETPAAAEARAESGLLS